MRTLIDKPDLDAYLRLFKAPETVWLNTLGVLLPCAEPELLQSGSRAETGCLAAFTVSSGGVCVIDFANAGELRLGELTGTLLVMPLAGHCDLVFGHECWQSAFPLAIVNPGSEVGIRAGTGARIALLSPSSWSHHARPGAGRLSAMAEQIHQFLVRMMFFQNHQRACEALGRLFQVLAGLLELGAEMAEHALPELDRRLVRAIEKIRSDEDWAFSLPDLASHSGVSERNLYYLMKRETGITPYRLYQRHRLVRIRRRLADCHQGLPQISWIAADEGFSHLGRFAALYREHLGELPSETVQWRRRCQNAQSERLLAAN